MAYMIAIVRASQGYEGTAWAAYDAAYRRQAAARGQTDWSWINPSLYVICFTGKAKRSERCDRCLSAMHKADDCSLTSEADPDVAKRLKAIESAVVTLTRPASARPTRSRDCDQSGETCRNWNRNRCSFPGCRLTHQCANCKGSHPAFECPLRDPNPRRTDPLHHPTSGAPFRPALLVGVQQSLRTERAGGLRLAWTVGRTDWSNCMPIVLSRCIEL